MLYCHTHNDISDDFSLINQVKKENTLYYGRHEACDGLEGWGRRRVCSALDIRRKITDSVLRVGVCQ